MLSKLINKSYSSYIKDKHNRYNGNYKMNDSEFNLYIEYIQLPGLHTYQGFKDYKISINIK